MVCWFGFLDVWKRTHGRIFLHQCQEVSLADQLIIAADFVQVIHVAGKNRSVTAYDTISIWGIVCATLATAGT
jgi:hypothetical protein